MMEWFRIGPSPFQTRLAMVGAKAGDRVLVVGAGDGRVAAEVALVTGLNGHVLAVDPAPGAAGRVAAAAARAGALVEFEEAPFERLPVDAAAFDVIVLNRALSAASAPVAAVTEAVRAVREGGRIVAIESRRRSGVLGALPTGRRRPALDGNEVCNLMRTAGLKAPRVLADREGELFIEGVRPRA
jgi:ubiquinone/menaquinone biosynthesis C-methylase UbiE